MSGLDLLVLMIAVAAILVAVAMVLTAQWILRPPRMTDGKALHILKRLSPADLGMHFELFGLRVRDARTGKPLDLAGWWMAHPAGSDRTVVLIHGYADAKVGAIAWAPTWQQLGFNVLAMDLRAHGESGGTYSTAGFYERHDLDQAINQLRAMHPQQTRQVVLFGVSMGAAVALATAELRNDLHAVVLDSPFATFAGAVRADAALRQLPLLSLLPGTIRIAQWISGARFEQVEPLELIGRVACPIFVIQSEQDALIGQTQMRSIESAVQNRRAELGLARHWLAAGAAHLQALPDDPDEYARQLREFLADVSSEPIAAPTDSRLS